MYLKKLIAVTLCICIAFVLCSCSGSSAIYTVKPYTSVEFEAITEATVFENSEYALEFNKTNGRILLIDKSTGTYWSTVPSEKTQIEYDEYGMPIKLHPQIESTIYVDYIAKGATTIERLYAYSDSVSEKTYKTEKTENGISVTYGFEKEKISVTVDFTVCEYGLKVSVDPKKICEGDNKVCAVSFAPFFCSVSNLSEGGYLFVPSGSGALIYPTEIESGPALTYSEEVYGRDPTVNYSSETKISGTESIRLPVFGVKNGEQGVCAIISEGAESAEICSQIGSKNIGYTTVYAQFNVRGKQLVYSDMGTKTYENVKYSENITEHTFSVIYSPLYGDDADYIGMAERYKEYLKEEMSVKPIAEQTSTAFELIGGVMVSSSFLGIPYSKLYTATTYEQAADIVSDFIEKTDITPTVLLSGYSNTGTDIGKLAGGFKTASEFGTYSQLSALSELCSELFLNFDLVRFKDSSLGYAVSGSSARGASGQVAYQYNYNIWSGVKDEAQSRYVLLKREKLLSAAKRLAEEDNLWSNYGVCLSTLSNTAYSDYTNGKYVTKSAMAADVSEIYGYFDKNSVSTAAHQANIYAALASQYVFEAPSASSQYDVFTCDVPFYQIVLKGLRPMSAGGINSSDDPQTAVLKAAESGMGIAFDLSGSYSHMADNAATQILFDTVYEDIADWVCKAAIEYNKYFELIKDADILQHKIVSNDLRITEFDNGVIVCVNYSDSAAQTEYGIVEAESYYYFESEVQS